METKFWLDSVTVRATLLGFVPAVYQIAKLGGLDLPDGLLEQVVEGFAAVLTLVSLVGVFIGRFKADKPLGFSKM